jgi:hypothetical protein
VWFVKYGANQKEPDAVVSARRITKMKSILVASLSVAVCLAILSVGRLTASQQSTQQPVPKVKVGTAVSAKANSPTPAATAKNQSQKTTIGKEKLAVKASQPSSFWTEEIDLEDDGSVESTDFLYDANRGVLYTYREDDFTCSDGQPGRAKMIQAVYTAGNKAGKPVGSGWYAVRLNEGKCGAKKAGEYGCRFDASGNPTECGAATVNYATGEVDVAVIQ